MTTKSKMIERLTAVQKAQLPLTLQKWLAMPLRPMERPKAAEAITALYARINEPKPLMIYAQSPLAAALMAYLCKTDKHPLVSKKDQLGDQLGAQLRDQLGDQLGAQLGAQLRDQLGAQLGDQLGAQLRDQLGAQLRDQLGDQLRDQLGAQLWAQLGDQLGDQLGAQLGDQLRDQLGDQLGKINDDWLMLTWIEAWAGWLDFGHFIGAKLDEEKLRLLLQVAEHVFFLIPYQGICFVSEKPTEIHWRERRLHRDGDAAVKFADDYGLYAWRGVRMERWMIETPAEQLDVAKVLEIKNVEQRTACIQKIGVERLVQKVGATTLDTWQDYTLLEVVINDRPCRYLKMKNPSIGVWHVEGVPNECRTVEEALHARKPDALKKIPIDEVNGEAWWQQGDVCIWPKGAKAVKRYPAVLT